MQSDFIDRFVLLSSLSIITEKSNNPFDNLSFLVVVVAVIVVVVVVLVVGAP